jgi:replicative DNA helicase
VVFIDYLQILQPTEDKRSTKEAVDSAVTELKRISREMDLTVIVISSVNRANYLTPIDCESLKESGGIEFTADVVWGLQLQCLNDPLFEKANSIKDQRAKVKEAKAATPRRIELVCLKNRYGVSSYSCYFDYYPAADLFIETDSAGESFTNTPKAGRRL